MTVAVENGIETPACQVGILTELRGHEGQVVRTAATGALQVFDDGSLRQRALLVIGPPHINRVLRFLGIDPAALPQPGEAADAI